MPLMHMIKIGWIFHFRNMNSRVKNRNSAVLLSDNIFCSDLSPLYSANHIIVTAAEMIRPDEADFKPFRISSTQAEFWCV